MQSTSESIITGVLSGILTTALLFLISRLFESIVLPWYRTLIYRGVDISGQWKNEISFDNGVIQTSIAEVNQKAHSVDGSLTVIKFKDGKPFETKLLRLSGELKDRLLLCSIRPNSNKEVAAINLLLEVVGNGSVMKGFTSWYDSGAGIIKGGEVEWKRTKGG